MKPQDIEMVIKLARKLIGYAELDGFGSAETSAAGTYLAPKLGVTSTEERIDIWLRPNGETSANAENRVFYAFRYGQQEKDPTKTNFMILVYRQGLWMQYLLGLLQEKEKQGYAAAADQDLFAELKPKVQNASLTVVKGKN
jgi:hypothetical protein